MPTGPRREPRRSRAAPRARSGRCNGSVLEKRPRRPGPSALPALRRDDDAARRRNPEPSLVVHEDAPDVLDPGFPRKHEALGGSPERIR